ncbi:DUF2157 domain-containing protein [Peribacillus frigoritolerans]|uniref:DUF2157 domain-containing protein n=1 Tax=Peribacillus TaxID=2675229 RepID=UPI00070A3AAF|nr:DUF2157 domain-containing protein [Peribacillus frigoritolerans]KRF50138.1 hypothetical protein ASG97_15815 [Bacillus sp. Soil745]PEO43812.1 DUF2157 domain-containing protein [Bacillus sp. AFS026049]PHD78166.1 DUF2157 domain-containing protein [Bacillus sp. AFS043905]PRS32864.1 DUF2157 domain-containing protein [Bacillus sp. RJGP41]QNK50290.1 DUF2157 domain-containing protein [Brevibacterium sp. PAMC23299]
MANKAITKKQFDFLEHEFNYLEKEGVISRQEKVRMLGSYDVKGNLNFITILLSIGALLLGLGVLTFVASNWIYLSKAVKFLLIIACLIGVNFAGVKVQARFPKTSRSLHYAGILIFGAGIFLVEQMFNISINFNNSFLLWAIGTVFIGYYLKDVFILLFTSFLLFIYLNGSIFVDETSYPLAILVFLPALYILLKKFDYPNYLTFFINALAINTIALFLMEFVPKLGFENSNTIVLSILFVLGIVLAYIPVRAKLQNITHIQGHILHGLTALFLTFDFSIWFPIAYFVFLLYLILKGSLTSIVIICALIFRYYIYSFDFLPKSLTFIIGGIMLIGFGFFFENQRKKGGELNE